ncbi:hypothetical protein Taro_017636 [Colocasia esculenta]|uniref:Uncharacterized protein n=1 Tax=Colocasia esculenta TaxID=4460 RepID=A0A843V002_COLES|nr:hypothetical protein [Colocasia esculenta]
MPVGMPGSSCLLKMGRVTWGCYNRSVGQKTCSAPSGHTFRAGLFCAAGLTSLFGSIPLKSSTMLR